MKRGLCPDFPFYPNDWLGSTNVSLMTLAEQGAFLRLLCHAWSDPHCCLPDDDAALARLSMLNEAWTGESAARIRQCFCPDPERKGKIFNPRQREVREEQHQRISEGKKRALAGANGRWHRPKPATATGAPPKQDPNIADASSTHGSSIADASPTNMLVDASSPVSLLTSPVSHREGEGDVSSPFPEGFPKTETEAVASAASVPGCTPEFARKVWLQAAARGGTDYNGNPVMQWPLFLAGRVESEKNKPAARKAAMSVAKADHSKGF